MKKIIIKFNKIIDNILNMDILKYIIIKKELFLIKMFLVIFSFIFYYVFLFFYIIIIIWIVIIVLLFIKTVIIWILNFNTNIDYYFWNFLYWFILLWIFTFFYLLSYFFKNFNKQLLNKLTSKEEYKKLKRIYDYINNLEKD